VIDVGRFALRAVVMLGLLLQLAACGGGGSDASAPSDGPGPTPPGAAAPSTVASAPAVGTAQPLISLSSDGGDTIGQGRSYNYDTSNAAIRLTARGGTLDLRVAARENWSATFVLPSATGEIQPGTYTALSRYPFQPVGSGAMEWSGEGRGCNQLSGTVVVHAVTYESGLLRAIDLGFEQRCDGTMAALRGRIRVQADQMGAVAPLQNPLSGQPVLTLTSETGDTIGIGGYYAYDSATAAIVVRADGGHLRVQVAGDESWFGDFQMPGGATALVPGTYGALVRYPFQAPGEGGLSWSGEGRGCNTVVGSVTIHSVRYGGDGALAAIDMRFDQHCDGAAPALRGRLTWDATTPVPPAGPVPTAPVGLWQPPAGAMAATGDAIYIASDWNDPIGGGYTYWVGGGAPAGVPTDVKGSVTVNLSETAGLLQLRVAGTVTWAAEFKAMDGLTRLQPGYYGVVQRYPFHNPARGGMSFAMDSRGCNRLSGWFMVDGVTYQGDRLTAIDLRFAQHCEGGLGALRGRIRWRTAAPGA
jgi:hypothetical protein